MHYGFFEMEYDDESKTFANEQCGKNLLHRWMSVAATAQQEAWPRERYSFVSKICLNRTNVKRACFHLNR